MENPEENENLEGEEQTGEQPRTRRGRGWPKGKARKPVPDVPLSSSVDGKESDGYIFDTEAGELQTPKGKGLKFPPNLPQIALIALIVSLVVVVIMTSVISPTVSRKQYSADIATLVTDIQNLRGSGYTSAMTVAGISKQYDTLNARSNAFLVAGDLNGYATDGELSSQLNSLRNSIPTADTIAAQVNAKVDAKLAQVDTKLATLGNTSNYVTQAQLNAAVAYLQSLMVAGGTLVSYNAVGAGATYAFLVGPAAVGNYTGVEINFTYPIGISTLQSSVGVTQFIISAASAPAGEVITYSTSLSGSSTYVIAVKLVLTGAGIPTQGGVYWSVGAANLDLLGTPTTVVVKTKP